MKARFILVFCVAVWAGSAVSAIGQNFTELSKSTLGIMKSRFPDAEITIRDEGDRQAIYNWKVTLNKRARGIGVLLFWGDSVEEASKTLHSVYSSVSIGPGKKLSNIGDEAFYVVSSDKNLAIVRFRKGSIYIKVDAPSLTIARNLAIAIAKGITTK